MGGPDSVGASPSGGTGVGGLDTDAAAVKAAKAGTTKGANDKMALAKDVKNQAERAPSSTREDQIKKKKGWPALADNLKEQNAKKSEEKGKKEEAKEGEESQKLNDEAKNELNKSYDGQKESFGTAEEYEAFVDSFVDEQPGMDKQALKKEVLDTLIKKHEGKEGDKLPPPQLSQVAAKFANELATDTASKLVKGTAGTLLDNPGGALEKFNDLVASADKYEDVIQGAEIIYHELGAKLTDDMIDSKELINLRKSIKALQHACGIHSDMEERMGRLKNALVDCGLLPPDTEKIKAR